MAEHASAVALVCVPRHVLLRGAMWVKAGLADDNEDDNDDDDNSDDDNDDENATRLLLLLT